MNADNLKKTLNDKTVQCRSLEEQLNHYKHQLSSSKLSTNQQYEEQMDKLNREIATLRNELTRQIEQNAEQIVSKEINIDSFKRDNENMSRKLSELEYLKTELKNSLERVRKLEQEKVDLNAEWRRKYEYLENSKSRESDIVNKQVVESRDQVGFLN
jgi:ABC-type transporter Mla subunit MlaD